MIFDTHCHLNFNAFKDDYDFVIKNCLKENIYLIIVGTKYKTSKRAVEIAEKYNNVYASVGLHPIHLLKRPINDEGFNFISSEEKFDYEKYKNLAKNKKVVAIGEIGFDYYERDKLKIDFDEYKKKQREEFLKQVNLAKELNLPIILHCRAAFKDLLKNLNNDIKGVIHCFTGDIDDLRRFLDLGFYIGFNGIIFKDIGIDFEKIIKYTPIDRILLETDSPYLTPPNFLEKRNNPLSVKIIGEKISEIKNINKEKIFEETTKNAIRLFKIDI
ncbi:MAG: TatD family hydrolase [Minisyncoccia bacterium]